MPNSKQIVYLSQAQYAELVANGTITVDGVTVTYDENDIYVTPQAEPVTDVRINGTSIAANGVANIPVADRTVMGVGKVADDYGIQRGTGGLSDYLITSPANSSLIKSGTTSNQGTYKPLTPRYQHEATFYGLAKIAGHDEKDSTEPIGTYTPEAKGAIQSMLGVSDLIATAENSLVASKAYAVGDVFTANGKLYKATAAIAANDSIVLQNSGETVSGANAEECKVTDYAVHDVQINGTSVLNNGIANIQKATTSSFGVVKILSGGGIDIGGTSQALYLKMAPLLQVKAGTNGYNPIMPENQHQAVFYGLAKAAGDTTQSQSDNAVGTYTDDAKSAIRTMLDTISINDIVPKYDNTSTYQKGDYCEYNGQIYFSKGAITTAEEWTADHWTETTLTTHVNSQLQRPGLVGITPLWSGVKIDNIGGLYLNTPAESLIKAGTDNSRVALIHQQHISTFYGLAKAAGDTTQSASSNAVGTYTDNAKASIKSMLGIVDGSTGTVDVSGAAPTIAAVENTRYVCGEVTSLDFTPAASGVCIVRFTSGSTPTLLTLPSTVKFPEWFDSTALETDTIYEMCITDGVYGAVMSWAL